jgi:hypothetical protein
MLIDSGRIVHKVRDRSGSGVCFNSSLLPPYLKRSRSIEELIPWLYLKGISTGDYQQALLGKHAKGLSANTLSRLKQQWQHEYGHSAVLTSWYCPPDTCRNKCCANVCFFEFYISSRAC